MSSDNENISEQVDTRLDALFGDDEEQGLSQENGHDPAEKSDQVQDHAASAELESRLDNFFEKKDKPATDREGSATVRSDTVQHSVIKDLKSVILSLEWEITDQVMQKLGEEILRLEETCRADKIVVAFLQLLGSLGKYIRKKRAEAHPDSIRLLHSVYENLEKVMLSEELSDSAKKKMLVVQVNKYKQLKKEIVVAKEATPREEPAKPEKTVVTPPETEPPKAAPPEAEPPVKDDGYEHPAPSALSQHEEVLHALENIRKTIRAEFSALREELRLWRESGPG